MTLESIIVEMLSYLEKWEEDPDRKKVWKRLHDAIVYAKCKNGKCKINERQPTAKRGQL